MLSKNEKLTQVTEHWVQASKDIADEILLQAKTQLQALENLKDHCKGHKIKDGVALESQSVFGG